jgi:uncharacterized RDD family membrane protein YckC
MKCPKCGFNSFDYLESCKKCGNDLKDFKEKFGLRSLLFPHNEEVASVMGQGLSGAAVMASSAASSTQAAASSPQPQDPPAGEAAVPHPQEEAEGDPFDLDWGEEGGEKLEFGQKDDAFAFDEASGQEFDFEEEREAHVQPQTASPPSAAAATDLDWEEEPLPDLSFSEDESFDSSLLEDAPDEQDLDELVDAPMQVEPKRPDDSFTNDESGPDLPGLHELDFEDLEGESSLEEAAAEKTNAEKDTNAEEDTAWGEISFDDEDFKPEDEQGRPAGRRQKAGEQKEGPSDPFDQPEPARQGPAPGPEFESMSDAPESGESSDEARCVHPMARFGAFWLDLFLVTGVFLLFLVSATRLLSPLESPALLPSMVELIHLSIPYYLLLFSVSFLYFTAFHFFAGQTPGKMLFGMRLERCDGSTLSLSDAFLHSVGGLVALLTLGLGFWGACRDPRGRGWNDRFAGTRLVFSTDEDV